MNFAELHLRAWHGDEDGRVHVLVHQSPAGSMRRPVAVPAEPGVFEHARAAADAQWAGQPGTLDWVRAMGRALAELLLPQAVEAVLQASWARLGPGDGLRLRLCLDEKLADLPWEFLRLPARGPGPLTGFLVQNPRLSLIREAPALYPPPAAGAPAQPRQQRVVFAGACGPGPLDPWQTRHEGEEIAATLRAVEQSLAVERYDAADDHIGAALGRPAAVFHYSGHTDVHRGRACLVRALRKPLEPHAAFDPGDHDLLYVDRLDQLLMGAGVRLAAFSACNSGRWAFAGPLLEAGLPALVGVQGSVSPGAAGAFFRKFYAGLAGGLSLDDAVIAARLWVLDAGVSPGEESCEWGAFMVYHPAAEGAVLTRLPAAAAEEPAQSRLRAEVQAGARRSADKRAWRRAIAANFSAAELEILAADVFEDLAGQGRLPGGAAGLIPGLPLENQILHLIEDLDRRGSLKALQDAVLRERPGLVVSP